MQDTPSRSALWAPAGRGTACTRQAVPFHRSANGREAVLVKEIPTAVQALSEVHDTPLKPLSDPLAGFGVGWMRQLDPCHASAMGTPVLPLVWCLPTAVHAAGPPQETAIKAPFDPAERDLHPARGELAPSVGEVTRHPREDSHSPRPGIPSVGGVASKPGQSGRPTASRDTTRWGHGAIGDGPACAADAATVPVTPTASATIPAARIAGRWCPATRHLPLRQSR